MSTIGGGIDNTGSCILYLFLKGFPNAVHLSKGFLISVDFEWPSTCTMDTRGSEARYMIMTRGACICTCMAGSDKRYTFRRRVRFP